MGTSQPSNGPLNKTPLVPSWLPDKVEPSLPAPADMDSDGDSGSDGNNASPENDQPRKDSARPAIEKPPQPQRLRTPRSRFKDYAKGDRGAGRKALSSYVRKGTGGAKSATRKMGSARSAAGNILQVFQGIQTNGLNETLKRFNLSELSGSSPVDICAGLTDVICNTQHGGPIDEAIARDAWLETVSEISNLGINDLESLTPEQIEAVFIEYITNSIEARIMQDIGAETLQISEDLKDVEDLDTHLHDYINGTVQDAIDVQFDSLGNWNDKEIADIVDQTYRSTFSMLEDEEDQ